MPVPKEFKGKKGRSGRKSKAEEVEGVAERIRQDVLIDLANRAVYKRLKVIEATADKDLALGVKDIALPITLKGMVDRTDITSDGKSIGVVQLPIRKNESSLESDKKTAGSVD